MLENSKVILSKNIKVDREMKNVLSYSPTQLINLMTDNTHLVASDDHCSFIKERGTLQIDIDYSRVLGSNYMAYQNSDYSNKWFFCWIDEVLYKGNNNTEIVFTVDPFETFYSDLDFENAYVIREHVNDDTIGANTVPEDIDIGDVIQEGDTGFITELAQTNYYIALDVTARPKDNTDDLGGDIRFFGSNYINGLTRGTDVVIIKTSGDLNGFLHRMNVDDQVESIKNLYIVPSWIFTETGLVNDLTQHFARTKYDEDSTGTTFYFYTVNSSSDHKTLNLNVNKNTTFTGITLKNNKCKVYPYNYLLVSNNLGNTTIYKYEDFSTSNCTFDLVGLLSIGGSFKLIPKNYKGIAQNFDESMPLAKYPTISWSADSYTSWLTQNASNEYSNIVTEVIMGALEGAETGGFGGAIGGALMPLARRSFWNYEKIQKSSYAT